MSQREVPPGADFLELISQAVSGFFPGPILETLIARMETRK